MEGTSRNRERAGPDGLVIDLAARRLVVDGREAPLEPRVFDMLACLAAQAGRAVSRDALLDAVWSGQVVEDAALTQAAKRLRRAMGSYGGALVTLRGHGYRLDIEPACVRGDGADLPAKSRHRSWRRPAIIAAVLLFALAVLLVASVLLVEDETQARAPRLALALEGAGETREWASYGFMSMLAETLPERFRIDVLPASTLSTVDSPANDLPSRVQVLDQALGTDMVLAARLDRERDGYRLRYELWQEGARVWAQESTGPELHSLMGQLNAGLADRLDAPLRERLVSRRLSTVSFVNELFARGRQARHQGDFRTAARHFELALEQDPSMLWAKYELADTLRRLGQWERAQKLAGEIAEEAEVAGDADLAGQARATLGILAYRRGDMEAAQSLMNQALVLHEAAGATVQAAYDHNVLGVIAGALDRRAEAMDHYSQALGLYRDLGDPAGEAKILNNLGHQAYLDRDMPATIDYTQRALEIQQRLGLRSGVALSMSNLSAAFMNTGRLQRAGELATEALIVRREIGDAAGQVTTTGNLASLAAMRGQVEQGLAHAEHAVTMAAELESPELLHIAQHKLADIMIQGGQFERAAEVLDEALGGFKALEMPTRIRETQLYLARNSLASGDRATARAWLGRAARDLDPDQHPALAAWWRLLSARSLTTSLNEPDEVTLRQGLEHLDAAVILARRAGEERIRVQAGALGVRFCLETGDLDCASRFVEHTLRWQREYVPAALAQVRMLAAEGEVDRAGAELERVRAMAGPAWEDELASVGEELAQRAAL